MMLNLSASNVLVLQLGGQDKNTLMNTDQFTMGLGEKTSVPSSLLPSSSVGPFACGFKRFDLKFEIVSGVTSKYFTFHLSVYFPSASPAATLSRNKLGLD